MEIIVFPGDFKLLQDLLIDLLSFGDIDFIRSHSDLGHLTNNGLYVYVESKHPQNEDGYYFGDESVILSPTKVPSITRTELIESGVTENFVFLGIEDLLKVEPQVPIKLKEVIYRKIGSLEYVKQRLEKILIDRVRLVAKSIPGTKAYNELNEIKTEKED